MKKILCLIIDSAPHEAWRETYETHRKIWHQCLDLSPHVDGYFLYSDPNLKSRYSTGDRRFTARHREGLDTILHKTQKAIEVLLDEHEYVIRTNISSLWDFPLMEREDLPKKHLYTGHEIPFPPISFATGSGMILSRDVAKRLVRSTLAGLSPHDDVAIAQILNASGLRALHRPWFWYDYSKELDQISVGRHLHYRLRDSADPDRRRERGVTEHLFKLLYRSTDTDASMLRDVSGADP